MPIKNFFIAALIISVSACGTAPVRFNKQDNQKILNLGERFSWFWDKARKLHREKEHDKGVELWNKYIEGNLSGLYKLLVWKASTDPNWENSKRTNLRLAFDLYERLNHKISPFYDNFEQHLEKVVGDFRETFPDAKLETYIYLLPFGISHTIGYANIGIYNHVKKHQFIIVLSSDMMALFPSSFHQSLAHELFHIYYYEKLGIPYVLENYKMGDNRPWKRILLEGLAEWGTRQIYPGGRKTSLKSHSKADRKWIKDVFKVYTRAQEKVNPDVHCDAYSLAKNGKKICINPYIYGESLVTALIKKHGKNKILHSNLSQLKKLSLKYLRSNNANPLLKPLIEHFI